MRRRSQRNSEQGYALLMIFLMAAIVALMLYQQLPRVAFESERDKEQLLIDRGEQYTRAIQLYYLANNRQYPTSLDDLEKREKRFLRHRYVDPFTGKDEWRIIHTTGGFLTDSLVQKPPTAGNGQSGENSTSASNSTNGTNNGTGTDQPPQVNAAVLQRPSDRPVTPPGFGQGPIVQDPSAGQDQGAQQQVNSSLPPITLNPQQGLPPITLQPGATQPGGLPPITLVPAGGAQGAAPNSSQIPGQVPGQIRPAQGTPGQGTTGQGAVAPFPGGIPGGIQPGAPPGFRIDANGQLVPTGNAQPAQGQAPFPGIPGQPTGFPGQVQGFPGQPGAATGSSNNTAISAINQLLTSPRQTPTATSSPTTSNQVGAIAGIASTHKGPSIKVYKDQTLYEMWEFVFSPTASTVPGGGAAIPGAGAGATPGTTPGNGQGRGGPSGIGAPNFGGGSIFGSGPGR